MFYPLLCNQTGLKIFKPKQNFEPQQLHCGQTTDLSESGITASS